MSTGIGYGLLHNLQKNSLRGAEIWEIVLTTGKILHMTSMASIELNIALVRTEHSLIHSSPCISPDLLIFVDLSYIISCKQRPNNSRLGLRKYSYL